MSKELEALNKLKRRKMNKLFVVANFDYSKRNDGVYLLMLPQNHTILLSKHLNATNRWNRFTKKMALVHVLVVKGIG